MSISHCLTVDATEVNVRSCTTDIVKISCYIWFVQRCEKTCLLGLAILQNQKFDLYWNNCQELLCYFCECPQNRCRSETVRFLGNFLEAVYIELKDSAIVPYISTNFHFASSYGKHGTSDLHSLFQCWFLTL